MINKFLARAEDLPDDLTETIDALLHLKGTVGERIAGVQKELVAIASMIKGYEEDQKMRKGTLLKKGFKFYKRLLKFDGRKIMQAIEEEIEAAK